MKSEIENLFSDEILNQAIELFELEKDKTIKIDSFESFILERVAMYFENNTQYT